MAPNDTPQLAQIPPVFADLAETLLRHGNTIEGAKLLGDALNSVPQLQKWLKEQRGMVVAGLKTSGQMSYTEQAKHLHVRPETVSQIARDAPGGAGYAWHNDVAQR